MDGVDRLVLATVNASTPRAIDAATLATCLSEGAANRDWLAQLCAFFTEVPLALIESFAAAHGLDAGRLATAYGCVRNQTGDKADELEEWLAYLGYPLAPSTGVPR